MKKQLDVRVKDNFLSDRDFWFLKDLFFNEQTIYYPTWKIADLSEVSHPDNFDDWFLTHPIYDDTRILSTAFDDVNEKLVGPIRAMENTDFAILARLKVNFYPHTHEVNEHLAHTDASHTRRWRGGIYCLNTCDGYTGFADGTKVDSVENRLILFDSLEPHYSTSTSHAQARLNININYV